LTLRVYGYTIVTPIDPKEAVLTIGERVRARRRALDLTQEEIARRAGVSLNLVNRVEREQIKDPHVSTLRSLARGLGVSVEELVKEEPGVSTAGKVSAPTQAGLPSYEQLRAAGVSEETARELTGAYSRSEDWWRWLTQHIGIEAPPLVKPGVDLEDLHNLGIPTNASEINVLNLCIGAPPSTEGVQHAVDEARIFALLGYALVSGLLSQEEIEVARETLHRKLTEATTDRAFSVER
jgi:transcriptional regulator with XRE-family HTH domain